MGQEMSNRWESPSHCCLAGHLLIAAPHWQHEFFGRAVCLVVHHSPQGAFGILLNRNLASEAPALWEQLAGENLAATSADKPAALNLGGTQSGPVVAVHNRRELAEFTSADGVYFAAQIETLRRLVASSSGNAPVKIVVGQSDWSAGQLDREFADGKWLPLPISPALVFADESDMWSRAMREIGNRFVADVAGAVQPAHLLAN